MAQPNVGPGADFFDEPEARTRMAWIRTALILLVVGFLVGRSMVVGAGLPALVAVPVLLWLAFVALLLRRAPRLHGAAIRRLRRRTIATAAVIVVGMAATGLAAVTVTAVAG